MTIANDSPPSPAQRLERLLEAETEAFLRESYLLLLGRTLDASGERFYAARLKTGAERVEVLRELAHSDEARQHLATEPALAAAVAHRLGERPDVVADVEALLALNDREFVKQAFLSVLGMAGDARSHAMVDARLRGGVPRVRVIEELAAGRRPQRPTTRLAGLEDLLERLRDPTYPTARDVAELMTLHDEAFVECAYRTLLGRAPDPAGLHHYAGQLRDGRSRHRLLVDIASSSESRARGNTLPGLARIVAWQTWVRLPLVGSLVSRLSGIESESAAACRLRMLQGLVRRTYWLESRLADPAMQVRTSQTGAPSGTQSLRQLETDFLGRLDAMLDIQRDSFDREMNALRRLVLRVGDKPSTPAGPAPRSARRTTR